VLFVPSLEDLRRSSTATKVRLETAPPGSARRAQHAPTTAPETQTLAVVSVPLARRSAAHVACRRRGELDPLLIEAPWLSCRSNSTRRWDTRVDGGPETRQEPRGTGRGRTHPATVGCPLPDLNRAPRHGGSALHLVPQGRCAPKLPTASPARVSTNLQDADTSPLQHQSPGRHESATRPCTRSDTSATYLRPGEPRPPAALARHRDRRGAGDGRLSPRGAPNGGAARMTSSSSSSRQ